MQRFDFDKVILPHKDHKISNHAQRNEHLKDLAIEESASIGHGQFFTRDHAHGETLSV
jgi:hypothetical protein